MSNRFLLALPAAIIEAREARERLTAYSNAFEASGTHGLCYPSAYNMNYDSALTRLLNHIDELHKRRESPVIQGDDFQGSHT